jgi:hypothetical protein
MNTSIEHCKSMPQSHPMRMFCKNCVDFQLIMYKNSVLDHFKSFKNEEIRSDLSKKS